MAQQYPPFVTSGTSSAAGTLTLTFTGRGSQLVRLTQVGAEMPGGGSARCVLRRNGAFISALVPTGGAAGGDPPIWLWPGDAATVEWTNAPVGLVGTATFIYDLGDSR